MNTIPDNAFPLQWPVGKPRTAAHKRQHARFDTSEASARDGLLKELKMLQAQRVIITTNVATYERGGREIAYANQQLAGDDPGVSVFYIWQGDTYALACDRWKTLSDNYQAIRKTIEAIRGLERWGTGDMLKAAFSGFKALPLPASVSKRDWWVVLGVKQDDIEPWIREKYLQLRRKLHPDAGGSHEAFIELQEAFEQFKKR